MNMMEWPKFSIVMATFNSMRTLDLALKALRAQDYPVDRMEILVVDGGSTDGTRELARTYGCRVLDNPRVEPVNAKLIGLREATGRYLMHVDSDEVLVSPKTLQTHARLYALHKSLRMVFSSGYVNPRGATFSARYINEFGDPFSMYFYRLSKDSRFFLRDILNMCRTVAGGRDGTLYEVGSTGRQPILENAACANSIDLEFFKREFKDLCDKPWGPVHFFYHMQKVTRQFAIAKNTDVVHHSADHWSGFLKKIKWRVRNNVFFQEKMGSSGFEGRRLFERESTVLRRSAYLPYAFLVVPAAVDAVGLMWSRRDIAYCLHVPLTLYTAGLIVVMKVGKVLGYRPEMKSYGEQTTIGESP